MSKRCAKCEKIVYPIEELKCLEKVWHKACFKCESCGMKLNMKNYKGYDKKPYCNAHYPTQKFTAVADTPEMNRLQQNTKNQSNLKYHADFERDKGKFTQVADDPETLRLMQNSAKFSSVKYHEDFEKNIKGTKIQVTDDPETQRVMEHSKVVSQVEYKGLKQQNMQMDQKRASIPSENEPAQLSRRQTGSVSGYDPGAGDHQASPYSSKFTGQSTMYTSQGQTVEQQPRSRRIGSINDYDPMNDKWGSVSSAQAQQHAQYTGGPTSGSQWEERVQLPRQNQEEPSSPRRTGRPPVGGVPMVPVNQPLALMVHPEQKDPQHQPQYYPAPAQPAQAAYQPPQQPAYQPPQQQAYRPPSQPPVQQHAPAPAAAPSRQGPVYTAMYDYDAQDEDEISFRDGDVITNVEPIDEGWMFGTVERTGVHGMLPANYVEIVG